MIRQFGLRAASAFGLFALAIFLVGLYPFFGLTAGAGVTRIAPAVSVDRTLKGDLLPLSTSPIYDVPDWKNDFGAFASLQQRSAEPRVLTPLGCDPAFSPIYTPVAANIFGRCMT